MMIDASLGRAGCGGFPPCGQGAAGMPFPGFPGGRPEPAPMPCQTPPQPAADALSIQLSTTQTGIAAGAVLPLGASVRQIGCALRYDTANHAVTVTEPGVYVFKWQVLVQSADAAADVVISLQSLDGTAVLASSGAVAVPAEGGVLVAGSAVAQLRPGTSWALVNNSGAAINLPAAGTAPAAFVGSETVYRLAD